MQRERAAILPLSAKCTVLAYSEAYELSSPPSFLLPGVTVPDDGLRPFLHVNVRPGPTVKAPAPEPSMSLDLRGIRPEQPRCSSGHHGNMSLAPLWSPPSLASAECVHAPVG